MDRDYGSVRSFVLRAGKISTAQKRSYDEFFPVYGIKPDEHFNTYNLFGNDNQLVIEIGFGMGRATADIADMNPGTNYLGLEVHKPGIGKLLWEIQERGLKNIRIFQGDAQVFLKKSVPVNSVFAFHIFFPDPWPKKRHHKRRLLTRPFTDLLASKLSNNGYIYVVTDWTDYADWILKELSETPGIKNSYKTFADKQEWRPITEFEKKGLQKKHEIRELFFIKSEMENG